MRIIPDALVLSRVVARLDIDLPIPLGEPHRRRHSHAALAESHQRNVFLSLNFLGNRHFNAPKLQNGLPGFYLRLFPVGSGHPIADVQAPGLGLLPTTSLCYKPYMRKWMQEKLKRRKKSAEDASAKPAPLQPAYFDSESEAAQPKPPAPESRQPKDETDVAFPAETARVATPDSAAEPGAQSADAARRPRRRRGRGGRGRKRPGQQPTATGVAPSDSVKPTATPTSISRPEPQRAAKGVVVLAVGLPGSGKSSWFKRHSITPLSSDMVRSLLFDDPAEQRFQDLVFSNLRSMLKARLIARRPMNYVDATNLTPQERHNWIKLAKDFGYEVHAVFFDVPLEVCIERHQRRDRIVPEDVMRKMSAKLKAPAFDEGFSKITVVRVKQKQE